MRVANAPDEVWTQRDRAKRGRVGGEYETLGGSHYIYQATITNFAALGLGSDITVHWGEICGNDWLRTTANVPLPSSLALFLLGGSGLAAGTRRRRV